MHTDIIANLRKEFKEHPEKYPKGHGLTWRIVLCDSDGTLIKATEGPITPINPEYRIMQLTNGSEKAFITFSLI